jgi:polar amino acid transport system substrate-binding protein
MSVIRCAVLLAMLLGCRLAGAETLRLVADAWPPFTSKYLPHNGLAVDLVDTALSRAGYTTEYIEVPWARVLHGLQQGNYDVVVDAWYSTDRTAYGQYSSAYLTNRIRFLQARGGPVRYARLDDLRAYSIAVVRGYAYSPAFDQDQGFNKVPVTEFGMAAGMLAAGRVQLTLEDELVAQHRLNSDLGGIKDKLEFIPGALEEKGLYILVRRSLDGYEQVVDGFNRAIEEMRADGTYQRIYARHGLAQVVQGGAVEQSRLPSPMLFATDFRAPAPVSNVP